MHIYIDRKTGTWGQATDLVFIDADLEGMMMQGGMEGDAGTVFAHLDNLSDSEIIDFAECMVDEKVVSFVGTYTEDKGGAVDNA